MSNLNQPSFSLKVLPLALLLHLSVKSLFPSVRQTTQQTIAQTEKFDLVPRPKEIFEQCKHPSTSEMLLWLLSLESLLQSELTILSNT